MICAVFFSISISYTIRKQMRRKIVFSFNKKIYSLLLSTERVDLYILNQMYIYNARCLWIRTYLSIHVCAPCSLRMFNYIIRACVVVHYRCQIPWSAPYICRCGYPPLMIRGYQPFCYRSSDFSNVLFGLCTSRGEIISVL